MSEEKVNAKQLLEESRKEREAVNKVFDELLPSTSIKYRLKNVYAFNKILGTNEMIFYKNHYIPEIKQKAYGTRLLFYFFFAKSPVSSQFMISFFKYFCAASSCTTDSARLKML